MKSIFFLSAFITATLGKLAFPPDLDFPEARIDEFDHTPHIVGGTPAVVNEFPYIVSLQSDGSHFCGGSLLNSYTIITAAHCTVGVNVASLRVRSGSLNWSSGFAIRKVKQVRIHPNYNAGTLDNDIALWRLAAPIIPNGSNIKFAKLPPANTDPGTGTLSITAGWGYTSESSYTIPTQLRRVTIPMVSRSTCNANYGGGITTNMICAGLKQGGKDSCQGDSGGPLVNNSKKELIGIVSWGIGCARPNYPGVYTRVSKYITWIHNNDWTS
jgi:trypsin